MGLFDTLRRLDEKMGMNPSPEQVRRRLKWWWVNPLSIVVVLLFLEVAQLVWGVQSHFFIFYVMPVMFISGFLYAERLRQLNQRSRFPFLWKAQDERVGDPRVSSEGDLGPN